MELTNDLISQFAKITNDETKPTEGTVVNGTAVLYNEKIYVRIDGSDQLTPVISSTAGMKNGDRVTVLIKNHTATVTGNSSSPSAGKDDIDEVGDKVDDIGNKITEFEIVIADKVSVKEFDAEKARIDNLVAENVVIKGDLTATKGKIDDLESDNVTIKDTLKANNAEIENLKTTKLDAEIADIKFATIENLEVTNADIHNLQVDYGDFKDLATDKFTANEASIKKLETDKLSATEADLKYANIDFANINEAAVEKLFAESGIIKDLILNDGHITGELVGVTIKGDVIEGGTIIADKLVVKGSDGLYYKLNTNGVTTEAEQTDYNSLNGSVITAKSITATKISVSDLVAFDATIGGFNITESSIYSGVKSSIDNTTRGIHLDKEGQVVFGDANNFFKYYRDSTGHYKLEVSAESINFGSSGRDLESSIDATVISSVEQFYQSISPVALSGGEWSETQPIWTEGKYIWRRTLVTYGNGATEYTPSENGVCITGNNGLNGKDSILLIVDSSNGTAFKNSQIATTMTVSVIVGDMLIDNSQKMTNFFGNTAKILWQVKHIGESNFTDISEDDTRLSDNGFIFTLTTRDILTKAVFNCILDF